MKGFERKQLLERVNREGATIGAQIPDRIDVQGEQIDLREFVFEIKRRDTVPSGERDRVERAKTNLRRERRERKDRLEEDDISREEGERLAEAIIGIDRALNALDNIRKPDYGETARTAAIDDHKRWASFLDQLG